LPDASQGNAIVDGFSKSEEITIMGIADDFGPNPLLAFRRFLFVDGGSPTS
jgi:hypothetical protein